MAESTPTPEIPSGDPTGAAAKPADSSAQPVPVKPVSKPRRRRWPKILLVGLALLILIVLLIPTIISTGPMRSYVVGKVNQNLNGTAEIDDWSIGWTSGIDVHGVRLKDDQGRLIFDCARITTQIGLIDLARGRYILGNTTLEEPNFVILKIDKDGTTNLQKLAKKPPAAAPNTGSSVATGGGGGGPAPEKPLPEVQVNLAINRFRATLITEGNDGKTQTVIVDPSTIKLNVKSLNDPIDQDVTLNLRAGTSKPAVITLKGTATIAQNNRLDLDKLKADDKLLIQGLDLAAATPFLAIAGKALQLGGVMDGPLNVTADGGALHAEGKPQIVGFTATGDALDGDTFKSNKVSVPINFTRTVVDSQTTLLKGTLGLEMEQGYVHVVLDLSQQAMDRVNQRLAPGRAGSAEVEINLPKLGELVNSLRHTFNLEDNASLTSGQLYHQMNVYMTVDKTIAQSNTYISGITGTNGGKPFKLAPITQTTDATILPGTGDLPNLEGIAVTLNSGFAHLKVAGGSVAKLNLAGDLSLSDLQKELGSLIDFSGLTMAGSGKFALTTDGDPAGSAPIKATSTVTVAGLDIRRDDGAKVTSLIKEEKLDLVTAGTVQFKPGLAGTLSTLSLTTADNLINLTKVNQGDFVFRTTPGGGMRGYGKLQIAADLKRLNDLLHQTSGTEVIAHSSSGDLTSGQLAGTLELADAKKSDSQNAGTAMTVDLTVSNLSVSGPAGSAPPISNEQVKVLLHAITPDDYSSVQADASVKSAFMNVDVKDARLKMPGSPPPAVASAAPVPPPAAPGMWDMVQHAQPDIDIKDLGKLFALADAFTPPAAASPAAPSRAVVSPAGGPGTIDTTPAGTPADTPAPAGRAPRGKPRGRRGAATNPTPAPAPAPAPTPVAPNPAAPLAVPATQPVPPLKVTAGSAHISLTIDRQQQVTKITNSHIEFSNLKLKRGDVAYPLAGGTYAGSIALAADIAATDEIGKTPVQQIRKISITKLDGDTPLGKLSLKDALVINEPGAKSPTATGTIVLAGQLKDAGAMLDALQGAKPGAGMPYLGGYTVRQTLGTQGSGISLDGSVVFDDFQVMGAGVVPAKGQAGAPKVVFSEKKMELTDRLSVDLPSSTLTITTLNLTSTQTKAIGMSAAGSIKDWGVKREFQNFELRMTPDLAQLWSIVLPSMTPEQQKKFADLKIAGNTERVFKVTGSFPADRPFAEGIKSLNVTGSVGFTLLDFDGLHLENAEIPIRLAGGVLTLTTPDGKKAAPIACNSGKLDLSGLQMTLGELHPRVSMPANTMLAQGVALNPVLADKLLGNVNPVFLHPDKAGGSIMVKVVMLDRLPVDDLMNSESAENDGRAEIILNIDQVSIIGGGLTQILSLVQFGGVAANIGGSIPNAEIKIAKGKVYHNMPLQIAGYPPVRFEGNLVLTTMAYDYLNMIATRELLAKISVLSPVTKYLPADWKFVFHGPIAALTLDPASTGQAMFKSLAKNLNPADLLNGKGNLPDLGGLLGGGKPDKKPKP